MTEDEKDSPVGNSGAGAAGARRSRMLVILFCTIVMLWGSVTIVLTSAPKTVIAPVEQKLRDNRVAKTLIPPMKKGRPPWLDLVEHFVVYAPFGIMAGVAGDLSRRFGKRQMFHSVVSLFVLGSMGWAVFDEYRQIPLPDRSADWSDLIAGWGGIVFGALVYITVRHVMRWASAARRSGSPATS